MKLTKEEFNKILPTLPEGVDSKVEIKDGKVIYTITLVYEEEQK